MAKENQIEFKVVADYKKAIKDLEWLRDNVAQTTEEYQDMEQEIKELTIAMNELTGASLKTTQSTQKEARATRESTKEYRAKKKELENTFKSHSNLQKGLDGTTKSTGAASAAAMELGRIVSDAPYGIRGMANNFSQLASQITFMANATDKATGKTVGWLGAFENVGKSLMGPTGVLFAIQAVIAAIDYFANRTSEAKEEVEDLNKSLREQVQSLRSYKDSLNDSNLSLEQRLGLIKILADKDEDFAKILENSGEALSGQLKALEDYLSAKEKELRTKERVNRLDEIQKELREKGAGDLDSLIAKQEEYNDKLEHLEGFRGQGNVIAYYTRLRDEVTKLIELRKEEARLADERKKIEENTSDILRGPNTMALQGTSGWYKMLISQAEKKRSLTADTTEEYRKQTEYIEYLRKELQKLTGEGDEPEKIDPFRTPEELEISIKSNENAVNRMRQKLEDTNLRIAEHQELSEVSTEEEKRKIREKYRKLRLENQIKYEKIALELRMKTERMMVITKTDNHIKDLERATELYKHQIDLNDKLSQAQKEQAKQVADSQLRIATNQARGEEVQSLGEIESKYKGLFNIFFQLANARRNALGIGNNVDQEGASDMDKLGQYVDMFKQAYSEINNFLSAQLDRELVIERNRTNALNEELNNRLLNEQLSADERRSIQNQIWRNDENLRKKEDQINRKKFRQQKAFNIAMATVDTARAAAGVMADAKGGFFTRLSQALPTIAFGLAQVATIASQKYQSSSARTPIRTGAGGGAGGGVGDRSFNFTLAGQTEGNQLVDAIQSQFNNPIRAYVVSGDVTNQQQLDANIQSSASF